MYNFYFNSVTGSIYYHFATINYNKICFVFRKSPSFIPFIHTLNMNCILINSEMEFEQYASQNYNQPETTDIEYCTNIYKQLLNFIDCVYCGEMNGYIGIALKYNANECVKLHFSGDGIFCTEFPFDTTILKPIAINKVYVESSVEEKQHIIDLLFNSTTIALAFQILNI